MKTACVLGATGMTGSYLVDLLIHDPEFTRIKLFVRKSTNIHHPKIEEHLVDFDQPEKWRSLVKGDVAFSAFGTTLAKAGSKEAQWKIDHTYQLDFARAAEANHIPVYVLISSMGANSKSRFFYMQMKGDLDEKIMQLTIHSIHILRPGSLMGDRNENRPKEKWSLGILKALNTIGLLRKYRPIHGKDLAIAMIKAGIDDGRKHIWEYAEFNP